MNGVNAFFHELNPACLDELELDSDSFVDAFTDPSDNWDEFDDELLVSGWIREGYKSKKVFPMEIIQLIQQWMSHTNLHLIASKSTGGGKHWKIDTKILLDHYNSK